MESDTNKQNILIFSTAYFPHVGGAETAIKGITDRITDKNFYMITAKMKRGIPSEEKVGNIMIYRIGFGFKFDRWLLPFIGYAKANELMKKLPNVVLWGMMASQSSIAAWLLKKTHPKIPFLLTLQEGDPEEYLIHGRMGLMGFFIKRLTRSADQIQVISQYLKNFAKKMGARCRIDVIPNGVNLDKFQSQDAPAELKNIYNIKDGDKIIITVSRLVKKNAVDIIIRAMKWIDAKFLILGVGPDEDKLKKLAKDIGVEDKIIWGGLIDYNKLSEYLALADVFVRPSRSEGLGSAFLEAMACGVPVIATEVGGIPDFLKDKETGLFTKVDDPEDLADKIKIMLEDDILRKKIIYNGLNLVKNNYDWSKISQEMNEIFNNISDIKNS